MQAWILTLVILSAAGGALGNWWQSPADQVIMTDGANPLPPKS
jgi:hypothetical protein